MRCDERISNEGQRSIFLFSLFLIFLISALTRIFQLPTYLHTYRSSPIKKLIPRSVSTYRNAFGSTWTERRIIICQAAPTSIPSVLDTFSNFLHQSFDPVVFGATATASYKLFLVCAIVGWLIQSNRLPTETATVLSQVSFQVLIPCMLFTKVTATLAAAADSTLVVAMAVAAVMQILVGALWGFLLSPLMDAEFAEKLNMFGWKPFSKVGHAAESIAAATAAASGLPAMAGSSLLPRPKPAMPGYRQLVITASAFGNSFTLPAVFFLSLLPGPLADQAIAYCGLFLLAWSPCLWSLGLAVLRSAFTGKASLGKKSMTDSVKMTDNSQSVDVQIDGQGGWARLFHNFRDFVLRTLNPPVTSILFGVIFGMSPLLKQIILVLEGEAKFNSGLPLELTLSWAGVQGAYEVVKMLAGGTLAIQTLVLASSLLQKQSSNVSSDAINSENENKKGKELPSIKLMQSVWRALVPSNIHEFRALTILFLVRFLLVPVTLFYSWHILAKYLCGWAAPLAADPLFLFVIAVQSVMPSAQNLIIILQLSPETRPMASTFARMLLKLYTYSILPVTLWVTAFACRLSIPLM